MTNTIGMPVSDALGQKRLTWFFIILLGITAYLSIKGLADHALWDDEAFIGFAAKNFLKNHSVTGWNIISNGKNFQSYRDEKILSGELKLYGPPGDILITALSFKLFGPSTWSARFPFVIFGLLAFIIFFLVLRLHFPADTHIIAYSLLLLAFSYSYLLNIRQCRYYAVGLFLTLLAYYYYKKFVTRGKLLYGILCTGALIAFFYVNYLFCAAFLISLMTVHLLLYRGNLGKKHWAFIGAAGLVFACATLPFAFHYKIWVPSWKSAAPFSLLSKPILFIRYLRDLDMIGYLPGILILPLTLVFIFSCKRKIAVHPLTLEISCIILSFVAALSLLSPQGVKGNGLYEGLADVRYAFVLVPFCAILIALFLSFLHKGYGVVITAIPLVLLICTNLLSINITDRRFRWLFPAYFYEVHHPYTSAYDAMVSYVRKNISQDEIVFVMPEYAGTVLLFYLGDQFKLGSQLWKGPMDNFKVVKGPVPPLFIEDYYPDWVISLGMNPSREEQLRFLSRGPYQYVFKDRLDVYWQDMTRPELPLHSFMEPKPGNPGEVIYILKRQEKPK
ncbi:MAG: glycosyltransferase family 39 protein [Chitinivibrionales bacterium]|nr:glycosyltransferase family 39 protein [Chitinivibrionales bacterium]